MAFGISARAQSLSKKTTQEPSLVLEIDGVTTIYGCVVLKRYIRIGDPDLYIGDSWVIGGFTPVEDQEDIISLEGTTTQIQQQLLQDKGGTQSVSTMQIALLDLNEKATKLITPGEVVDDILGRSARIWLSYADGAYPEDYIILFQGVISQVQGSSLVTLTISSPEVQKNQEIFTKIQTTLASPFRYNSVTVQNLKWTAVPPNGTSVTIAYVNTGANPPTFTTIGNAISVNITTGVTTANQIRNQFNESVDSNAVAARLLVECSISGTGATPQTTAGATNLVQDTTVEVEDAAGFLTPADDLQCFVRIGDELVRYTAVDLVNDELTGCSRAQLGTLADSHDADADVTSFYRVQGTGLDLALKLLLSGVDGPWIEDLAVSKFVRIDASISDIPDAVFFETDVVKKYGITVGSTCTITGATDSANNVVDAVVSSMVNYLNGVYLILDGAGLAVETTTAAVASFRSQYDVLGEGAGLGQESVDVAEFERLQDLFNSGMPDYDFYIKDSITVREFVDQEILFPCGGYSIPRKGRISCGFTSPPLAIANLPNLDSEQIVDPHRTIVQRQIGRYFYNVVVFRYNEDVLEEKFLAGLVTADSDSLDQIPVGARPMTITSKGLRKDPTTDQLLTVNAQRLLERYRFAAEMIKAKVQYGTGFQIEVGDVVVYGDNDLLLPDSKFGTRAFTPRLMEVVNKSMNIKTGEIMLDLLDTSYLTDGRYGVFSPSSVLDSGSSPTQIHVTESFGIDPESIETDKWRPYIGYKLLIHDAEWTVTYETTLRGISTSDPHVLLVDTIGVSLAAGYIVEIDTYDDADASSQALPKALHCFWDPQIAVVTGISGTQLTVGAGDATKILPGAKIIVHNDWINASDEVKVDSIAGVTVTLSDDIGFTPDSSYFLELIGFKDAGPAYRWL